MLSNIAELAVREMELVKMTVNEQERLVSDEIAEFGGFSSKANANSSGRASKTMGLLDGKMGSSFEEHVGDQTQVTSPISANKVAREVGGESVILLVDTKSTDWKIVYASSSLADLTGISPSSAIGAGINSLFVGSFKAAGSGELGTGSTSIVLEGLRAEAEAGKAFVMQQAQVRKDLVRLRLSSEDNPREKSSPPTFMLSFKPGSLGPLDSLAPLIDMPAGLPPPKDARMLGLYFARVHVVNERQDLGLKRSQSSILSSIAVTDEKTHQTLQLNPLLGISVLFEGIAPVSVLGQGALGTVYKCTWYEAPVAVKVQDYLIKGLGDLHKAEVEVQLGESLDHVNIVRTVAHAAHFLNNEDWMNSQVGYNKITHAT